MKHILCNILGAAALLGLCASCEDFKVGEAFLEKPVTTDVNIDTVFSHRIYAEQILNEAYHSLPDFLSESDKFGWLTLEVLTDIGDTGGNPAIYSGQATASNPHDFYYDLDNNIGGEARVSGPISGIRQCWIYIENVDRVPDMTAEEKLRRKAEAKMIIAYHYSDMFRNYGGVPRIDHAYGPNEDFTFVRMTVEETVDFICTLCDEAAADLPWSVSAEDEGRMTAAGALALKSRVLTFAASPLFNSEQPFLDGEAAQKHLTWYGNKDMDRWQAALDAGLAFLEENQNNSNYWQLVDTGNPRADFLEGYYGRHQGEAMIVSHRYNKFNNIWYYAFRQLIWGNAARPSGCYGDMFEWKTGEPFDWSNPEHAANPFWDADGDMNRDPRMYETLWVNGDAFRGRTFELYSPGGRENWDGSGSTFQRNPYNGYGTRKFVLDYDSELFARYYQCPLMRLSEVYLNIAEAMNELGIADQKDKFGRDAYDYVNLVRARVDMPGIDRTRYPQGEELLEAILHERAVEFGFEEVRYYDINRRMRKDLLDVQHFRLKIYRNNDGSFRYERENGTQVPRIWIQPERWSNKYFLTPFPTDEVNKDYGLIQNPGWE